MDGAKYPEWLWNGSEEGVVCGSNVLGCRYRLAEFVFPKHLWNVFQFTCVCYVDVDVDDVRFRYTRYDLACEDIQTPTSSEQCHASIVAHSCHRYTAPRHVLDLPVHAHNLHARAI